MRVYIGDSKLVRQQNQKVFMLNPKDFGNDLKNETDFIM